MNKDKIINGDCIEELKKLPENFVDAIITDPPYGLGFMNKEWDSPEQHRKLVEREIKRSEERFKEGKSPVAAPFSKSVRPGLPIKGAKEGKWFQDWCELWATECLRVLKPGGYLLSFGGCYDNKTEVLTKDGWKFFRDITKNDEVITLNPETEIIEYQKPKEIISFDNYKQLYHFKTNKIDLMVTPNHKMLVKYLGGYENTQWKLVRADNVQKAIKMKKNGIWNGVEKDYFILPETKQSNGHYINKIEEKKIPMDIWLKFLGLWIAEGSSTITKMKTGRGYNVQICHFNNKNLDILEKELKPYFNICRYKQSGKFRINNKQLAEYLLPYCYSYNKHIPKEIKNLSSRQLGILLDWYMRGDSDGRRCYTCSKKLVDDIQEIALKIGKSADYVICKNKRGNIKGRDVYQKHIQYAVAVNQKQNEPEVYRRKRNEPVCKKVDYDGVVYCVEVEKYHTLYVRRNGKTSWCGNTRTYHRMVCGIEDAGFEIRDCLFWAYSQGFPKSLAIDKQIAKREGAKKEGAGSKGNTFPLNKEYQEYVLTENAKKWEGWGTALKPAVETIVVARKPLSEKNVALNVLKWGTGGINIDACRINNKPRLTGTKKNGVEIKAQPTSFKGSGTRKLQTSYDKKMIENNYGRFPANLILECICDEVIKNENQNKSYNYKDKEYQVEGFIKNNKPQAPSNYNDEKGGLIHTNPECPCYILDKQAGKTGAFAPVKSGQKGFGGVIYGKYKQAGDDGRTFYGDGLGGASRFFYVAKANKKEKGKENLHPTVKSLKLMEYLVKLITPPNGIVLDPFLGSGTTAVACKKLGFNYIGIEKEKEYCEIAERRINSIPNSLF